MKKILGVIVVSVILLTGIIIYSYQRQTSFSDELIQLMETDYAGKIDPETLQFYKDQIVLETEHPSSRQNLKKSYYALALIEHAEGNFSDSIQFFHKVLGISSTQDSTLEVLVNEGLAINYLALGNFEQSHTYFRKAEHLVSQLKNENLKGLLYNRYGYAYIAYTDHMGIAISLLEHCLILNVDLSYKLDAILFLSESYLAAGLYDRAIDYLISAFEFSIWTEQVEKQPTILMKLAIAFYLNQNYESSLNAIEQIYDLEGDNAYFPYFLMIEKSVQRVYGEELAESYLAPYRERLETRYREVSEKTDFSSLIEKAELLFYQGNVEGALSLIEQLDTSELKTLNKLNELENLITYSSLWNRSIDLWQRYEQDGEKSEQLMSDYDELYEQIISLNYSTIKILLLNHVVNQNILLENYERVYKYLEYKDQLISGTRPTFLPDTIQKITEKVMEEIEHDQNIKKQMKRYDTIRNMTVLVGTVGVILVLLRKYLKLKKQPQNQMNIQSLTQTLTKEAFYQILENYVESHHEVTFIMIDIDDFNQYNELYGYLKGDEVVKQLAQLIKDIFPKSYITRHRGQRFIIALEGPGDNCTNDLNYLFNRVAALNVEYATNLEYGRITISAGVSNGVLRSKMDIDNHINQAAYKLKLSQKRGKNTFTL